MTEEIKEILDRLYGFLYKVQNDFGFEYFTKREIELIFDYITNLQQLYENALKVNQNTEKYRTELETKCVILQQENEKLKEEINTLKSNFEVEIDDCEDYKKWYRDYKSRCEKAIEYIKSLSNKPNVFGHYGIDTECKKWLLKILNGGDKK